MSTSKIYKTIETLCAKKGCTINDIMQSTGLKKSFIYGLKTGENDPSISKIIAIADYFNVSIDYLVGRSMLPEINVNKNNTQDKEITIKITGGIVQIDGIEQ